MEEIKSTLCEVINALMSANPNERKLAEQQLDALQVTEGEIKLQFQSGFPDLLLYVFSKNSGSC